MFPHFKTLRSKTEKVKVPPSAWIACQVQKHSEQCITPENDDPSKYQENMTYNKEERQPEWSELTQMLELARNKVVIAFPASVLKC